MSKTHWKSLADSSQYLGKQHFADGEDKVLTIEKLDENTVENRKKQTKEVKRILHFVEDERPLILNVTNGKTIEAVLGSPYWEDWVGKKIALYVNPSIPNNFDPENPGAVRVRPYAPKETDVICADCGKKITERDGYSVNKIVTLTRSKYGADLCWDCATKRKEEADVESS